ncbi:MAG TPA: hypothetical protein VM118_09605 [Acidobacteriota bacterium]|nr:hypothetical protein [Acidobacteriota bacterium]
MKGRETTFLIVGMILAAVAGGLVGELVGSFLPDGTMKTLFTRHIAIGVGQGVALEEVAPVRIDLYAVSLVLGMTLRINLLSVLFVLLLFIYFRWWYL